MSAIYTLAPIYFANYEVFNCAEMTNMDWASSYADEIYSSQ